MVKNYFGDGSRFGVSICYSEDGPQLLGTGGSLKKASAFLSDPFLVIYGDSYMDMNYPELLCAYKRRAYSQKAMMVVYRNRGELDRSNTIYEDGKIARYQKGSEVAGPAMEYIDFGVAMMSQRALETVSDGSAADLAALYEDLAQQDRMGGFETHRRFYEIGTDRALEEFRHYAITELLPLKPAVFFDRDGTLNRMVEELPARLEDSPMKPEALELYPEAVQVLRKIRGAGYRLIVITNQPAAAKGKTSLGNLFAVNRRFCELLAAEGVELDALLMCPHHPTGAVESAHKD
ncbi:MAG: HAD-IIIA family hydrolase, partial [Candidatus Omnitrophota bacterium]